MKRTLFGFGLFVMSVGLLMLGGALYMRLLTDPLGHILFAVVALGALLSALMADPKPFLELAQKALDWKKGTSS